MTENRAADLRRALRLAGMRPLPRRAARAPIALRGKRILLTGASSGIGEVAAERLAALGATVIVVARRAPLLDELVERVGARGGHAIAMAANLADLDAVDDLVQRVGAVDILINNAGRSIRRPLLESLERWHDVERTIALNYYAPLRLIRGLAPGMVERGDGHIINISSWRVMPESSPLFGVYNASKAALSAVSRVIDNEMADSGVHSTTIYYPLVATPMIAPTRAYDGLAALSADEAAEWMVVAAQTRPVRIAPRKMLPLRALDLVSPRLLNGVMKRSTPRPAQSVGGTGA
ncbi:NAD(P)-dependent dehydrogenase (short-subunit alcohol dehydrogenase family) [Mycolicibacterium iranicum]|uniref:NAD(P)-dependent dehydrogenase (Short-subunit alcohol dehydrogenase family) n=1 Tax=Mycolicibacterium iranicum TaxID=912594 RepID=A0A839QA71_MYCIR|nr:SDR family oxidoreductase [Mycolicibacterium iranicum]MBB2992850.1 NAD(P)-dependent dehydrogenase (short-subunit alcohol dehydrogenase family) [Mycolicibacterium iranicum]